MADVSFNKTPDENSGEGVVPPAAPPAGGWAQAPTQAWPQAPQTAQGTAGWGEQPQADAPQQGWGQQPPAQPGWGTAPPTQAYGAQPAPGYAAQQQPYQGQPYPGQPYPGQPAYAGQPQAPYMPVPIGLDGQPLKSKMTAALLGIFLGAWGVHSFYLGDTQKGVIQIVVSVVTCGLGGLWGFVEGIMILTGNINTDAAGRPLVP